jgi:hypothetical protein
MSMSSAASKLATLRGLDGAKRMMERFLADEAKAHAVLFYGAVGAGKNTLADVLTQAWLCLNSEGNLGCGECKACVSFARGNNPDILRIRPLGASQLIRVLHFQPRAPQNKEEEAINPLSIFFRSGPLVSRHKVVIVEDAHRMNEGAANAFLKMLEEPPEFGKLILTTPSVGRLPATILSRCLAIACELPTTGEGENPDLWRISGHAPGRLEDVEANAETFLAIDALARDLDRYTLAQAPLLADQFRAILDGLEKGRGVRAANTEGLDSFAASVAFHHPNRPDWAQHVVETHRRIVGNASPAYAFDAMFSAILD